MKVNKNIQGTRGKYVETKPIHGSQKARWIDDNTLEVQLALIVNRELVSLLLSYGADLVVQKPAQLRKEIKILIERAASLY